MRLFPQPFIDVRGIIMQIPVLIEPVAGNGYRASGLGPDAAVADGRTDAEALENLRQKIEGRIKAGARITYLDVPGEEHPLAQAAGVFHADDPLVQEWKEIMAENRKRDNESTDWR
jgi:predicted RNase H-like HicB family nuclease